MKTEAFENGSEKTVIYYRFQQRFRVFYCVDDTIGENVSKSVRFHTKTL